MCPILKFQTLEVEDLPWTKWQGLNVESESLDTMAGREMFGAVGRSRLITVAFEVTAKESVLI